MRFAVYNQPIPQGSKKVVPTAQGWRPVDTNERKLKDWRHLIAKAAAELSIQQGGPLEGSVEVALRFYLPRPKGHFGKRGLRPSAPTYPAVRPDLDKLARAVLDALTSFAFHDDSQVVFLGCSKRYADADHPPGVVVLVDPARAAQPSAPALTLVEDESERVVDEGVPGRPDGRPGLSA